MVYFACPKCGDFKLFVEGRVSPCKLCGVELIDLDMTWDNYLKMSRDESAAWEKEIEETIIKTHPLYSETAHRINLANKKSRDENSKAQKSTAIVCPYCGYDKYQMVARKWSLLTGFLTNKVDRVCEKCKRRF